ncbi:MAG: deoxyribonuclease V [Alphaproteobacteria bacterium]|jgi:deoxyribonuclease V|nr:deoxyribonuclease V [Alphaproteobacteria bacterium]
MDHIPDSFTRTPESAQDAVLIQKDMQDYVRVSDDFGIVKYIAGIDVGYDLQSNSSKAALVIMDMEKLMPLETVIATDPTPFPYIPGLLSFREAPVIIKALQQVKKKPDMIFIDGQGIAHPRGLGIASHIGVLTGYPSIGVAKSVLCGSYKEPGMKKGQSEPLVYKSNKIGTVLRSRDNVNPLFISPGHKISHESAVDFVQRCLTRYRLPEPTRIADKLSKFSK